MHRLLTASVLGLALTATSAFAEDQTTTGAVIAPAVTAAAITLAQRLDLTQVATATPWVAPHRPLVLPALYAGAALLQGYDAYSTLTVLKHGGVEANPVMKGITKYPAVFIGLKAGMAAMSIRAAERMWKSNNRIGAVVTMVASNSLMAFVATNNARVLGQLTK
jgi:hypothetical protein